MSESVKKANLNRAQKAKAEHEKATKKRADDARRIKVVYLNEKDGDLLTDVLAKAKGFMKYNIKIAQDGVGSRATGDLYENGTAVMETYFLTPAERVSHLDKASGLQQLIDYIDRQLQDPKPAKTKKKAKTS